MVNITKAYLLKRLTSGKSSWGTGKNLEMKQAIEQSGAGGERSVSENSLHGFNTNYFKFCVKKITF